MAEMLHGEQHALRWQDPSQALWINLLPHLTRQEILKVGSGRPDNLAGLCHRSRRQVSCLGNQNGFPKGAHVRFYSAFEQLPLAAFDAAVVDEPEFFQDHRSPDELENAFERLAAALKPGGRLVVCLPDRLGSFPLRFRAGRTLRRAGFDAVQTYACEPSAAHPQRIVPLGPGSRALYCSGNLPSSRWAWFKQTVKRVLFTALGKSNPKIGLLLLARKAPLGAAEPSMLERVEALTRQACDPQPDAVSVLLEAYPCSSRQYFFVRDGSGSKLLSVAKLFDHIEQVNVPWWDRFAHARQEFEKAKAVYSLSPVLAEKSIELPEPLHFEIAKPSTLTLQRGVRGSRLDRLHAAALRHGDRATLEPLLRQLTEMQIFVQEQLTRHLGSRIPRQEPWCFENWLNLPIPKLDALGLPESMLASVQHGDFTLVNIYFDAVRRRWSLTDWEWATAGLPPLFDLFSLIRSFGYGVHGAAAQNVSASGVLAIQFALFEQNWFSQAVREMILRYCDHFQIPPARAHDLFLLHLLVLCNRYRGDLRPNGIRAMYEKAIRFAMGTRDKFILHSS